MAKVRTATTQADRMALIRECAKKFNKKVKRNQRVRKSETSFMDKYSEGNNINEWTDASAYANKYYGDTMRYTTQYDNDWN